MDLKKKMKAFFTLKRHANDGFTLVELIVVIAILAILAGVTVPAYGGYVEKAQMAADQQTLATMNTAFTVACMDKGHYDMTSLPFAPVASNIQTAVTVNSEVNTEFQTYFGGGTFQYFNDGDLVFNTNKGIFQVRTLAVVGEILKNAWDGSSFKDGGKDVVQMLLGTMDTIDGWLADGDTAFSALFEGTPSTLLAALGFTDMSDGFENMGVMHFAEDAKKRNAQDILTGANNLMTLLSYANDESLVSQITEDDLISFYGETIPEGTMFEIEPGVTKPWDQLGDALQLKYAKDNLKFAYGDLDLTPEQVVVVAGMAEGTGIKNSADVSGLAGMYALAAGFYNSEYGEDSSTKPTGDDAAKKYGEFGTVQAAMNDPKWNEYMEKQALKDMEAYVSFMGYLSEGEFGEDATFTKDGYEWIAGALGMK